MFEARGFLRLLSRGGNDDFGPVFEPTPTSPPGVLLVESGLEGFDLPLCLGGCGKEPMLTVLRSDLPAGSDVAGPPSSLVKPLAAWSFEFDKDRCGNADDETVRLFVAPGSSEDRAVVGPTFEFLDFATGSEGKGPVGGAIEGREGRGSELPDMVMGRAAYGGVLMQLGGRELALHCWRGRLCFSR